MIKDINEKPSRIEIDLTGAQGNAFNLIGIASGLAKQLGWNVSEIRSEMMSGDYENLIQVFDKYFGEFVTMYR